MTDFSGSGISARKGNGTGENPFESGLTVCDRACKILFAIFKAQGISCAKGQTHPQPHMPRPRIAPSSPCFATRAAARSANNRMQENIRAQESDDATPRRRNVKRRLFTSPAKVSKKSKKELEVFYY